MNFRLAENLEKGSNIKLLPSPSNNQIVGFCKFLLVDASRKERYNIEKNRQFEVFVWYPGENVKTSRKEYLKDRDVKDLFFLKFNFKKRELQQTLASIKTSSWLEIPVSNKRAQYPVLMFSHDFGMLPEYYTGLMEHLASEGYIVFSINHTYLAEASNVVSELKKSVVKFKKRTALLSTLLLFKARKLLIGKSYGEKWSLSKRILLDCRDLADANDDMTRDRNFLLKFLEQLDSAFYDKNTPYNIFSKHIDLTRVGVIGHGWGGASAVHSLIQNSCVKAAVNLNGFQFRHADNATIQKPLLVIYSEKNSEVNEGIYFCASDYYHYTIKNTKHNSFTDWPYYLAANKRHDQHALYETLNLVIHFFDKHLKQIVHVSLAGANNT